MFSSHFLAHCGWSRQPVIKETWSRKVVQIFHRGRHAIPRAVYKSSPTVRVTQTSKKKICSALVKYTTWHVRKQKQYLSRHVRVGLGHRPATSRYAGGISQVPLPRKRRASAGQAVSAPYTSNTEFVYLSTADRQKDTKYDCFTNVFAKTYGAQVRAAHVYCETPIEIENRSNNKVIARKSFDHKISTASDLSRFEASNFFLLFCPFIFATVRAIHIFGAYLCG